MLKMFHKRDWSRVACGGCFAIIFSMASCEKVVDLNLPAAETKYVIEAVLSDGGCRVNLSQTLNFADSNRYRVVSGANITLSEDGRPPVKLNQVNESYYRTNLFARPGRSYVLRVETDGNVFTATSRVPQRVVIDTLYLTERIFFGRRRKVATLEFADPPGTGNAYRIIQYVNARKNNNILIVNDLLMDGQKTKYEMLIAEDEEQPPRAGDQITAELLSITPFMYQYWYSLNAGAMGQSESASPGNPLAAFEGGALGYFSTHTVSSRSLIIQ